MKTDTTSNGAPHDAAGETLAASPQAAVPRHIGRYRIEKLLGQGGFGSVYLAHDDQLQRLVAIKVPHLRRLATPEDAAAYLTEARTAAGLDHPNIVPVYDFGSSGDCPCFIVSKYIEGVPLSERIKFNRPASAESAELVATIAEALHYAHRKRLVHRDVKPGNILTDTAGTPFMVDFGIALKEENTGKGFRYAGTPAYMTPNKPAAKGTGWMDEATSSAWAWSSTNCSPDARRSAATHKLSCWSRSGLSSHAPRDNTTTIFPKNSTASA